MELRSWNHGVSLCLIHSKSKFAREICSALFFFFSTLERAPRSLSLSLALALCRVVRVRDQDCQKPAGVLQNCVASRQIATITRTEVSHLMPLNPTQKSKSTGPDNPTCQKYYGFARRVLRRHRHSTVFARVLYHASCEIGKVGIKVRPYSTCERALHRSVMPYNDV